MTKNATCADMLLVKDPCSNFRNLSSCNEGAAIKSGPSRQLLPVVKQMRRYLAYKQHQL